MDDEQMKALIQKHTSTFMADGVSMDINVPPNNHAVTIFNKKAFAKELLELEREKIADWMFYEYSTGDIFCYDTGKSETIYDIANKIRKGEHDSIKAAKERE